MAHNFEDVGIGPLDAWQPLILDRETWVLTSIDKEDTVGFSEHPRHEHHVVFAVDILAPQQYRQSLIHRLSKHVRLSNHVARSA